jgi:hypothetical protein
MILKIMLGRQANLAVGVAWDASQRYEPADTDRPTALL